jgi:hypothetical protein
MAEVYNGVEVVELRCPVEYSRQDGSCHPGKLLALLRLTGGRPSFVQPDNLIEMECKDCMRRLRKARYDVRRVLHRYDMAGELIETLVVDAQP